MAGWLATLAPVPELAQLESAEQAARGGNRAAAEPPLRELIAPAEASAETDRLVGARASAALARALLDAKDAAGAEPLVARDSNDREARHGLASALAADGAIFDALGSDHPLTRDFRRRLQIVT